MVDKAQEKIRKLHAKVEECTGDFVAFNGALADLYEFALTQIATGNINMARARKLAWWALDSKALPVLTRKGKSG